MVLCDAFWSAWIFLCVKRNWTVGTPTNSSTDSGKRKCTLGCKKFDWVSCDLWPFVHFRNQRQKQEETEKRVPSLCPQWTGNAPSVCVCLFLSSLHDYVSPSYTCIVITFLLGFLEFFRLKDESSSSDEDHRSSNQVSGSCQSEPGVSPVCYKKTLRLTSEQLVQYLILQPTLKRCRTYYIEEYGQINN